MSFYVHLPSNGSQTLYPSNTPTNFTISLPIKLQCNPLEYEVGLTEISYFSCLKVLTGIHEDNLIVVKNASTDVRKIFVKIKNYESVFELIEEINETLEKGLIGILKVHYFENKKRVRIGFNDIGKEYKLQISKKLSLILGFEGETEFLGNQEHLSKLPPSLYAGFHHIFIYCDIIEPQIVGGSMVPLLRMISNTNNGFSVVHHFTAPYYYKIAKSEISNITVLLCDEFGEQIKLDKGPLNLTLHFKRKQ